MTKCLHVAFETGRSTAGLLCKKEPRIFLWNQRKFPGTLNQGGLTAEACSCAGSAWHEKQPHREDSTRLSCKAWTVIARISLLNWRNAKLTRGAKSERTWVSSLP